ncbi:MAG: DUF4325 domain-containing protein [Patescibacteria group bacterium]
MATIQKTILDWAASQKTFVTHDVVIFLNKKYTRQYIQRGLNKLVNQGKLIKTGSTKSTKYATKEMSSNLEMTFRKIYPAKGLEEHMVWDEIKNEMLCLRGLHENVLNLLFYAFSEMLNNAIDHSQSKKIQVNMENKENITSFIIIDWGVGVFKNIMKKNPYLKNPKEAIQELLKGKLTTDPKRHTGEGIFFTSKVCDSFRLNSGKDQLVDDKETGEFGPRQLEADQKGTAVFCEINKDNKNRLNDIFTKYYTNPKELDFDKTEIKIELYTIGRACISRSQAKRVLNRLDRFKKVILDFSNVVTVGQGFADEVFRVFKNQHPEVNISPINMNSSVKFMVNKTRQAFGNI